HVRRPGARSPAADLLAGAVTRSQTPRNRNGVVRGADPRLRVRRAAGPSGRAESRGPRGARAPSRSVAPGADDAAPRDTGAVARPGACRPSAMARLDTLGERIRSGARGAERAHAARAHPRGARVRADDVDECARRAAPRRGPAAQHDLSRGRVRPVAPGAGGDSRRRNGARPFPDAAGHADRGGPLPVLGPLLPGHVASRCAIPHRGRSLARRVRRASRGERLMRVAPLAPSDRPAWDAFVVERRAGFMQSWSWSRVKELEGYRALRLALHDDGDRMIGGAIAYVFPTSAEAQLAAVPDGPVLDWTAPDASVAFSTIVSALEAATVGDCVAALRVEPRLETIPEALRDLPRAPLDLVPVDTLEIELGPEAEMLARMKPKGRYNARLAARHGVEVTTSGDPSTVHDFYDVLSATGSHHGFFVEPKSFFINLAQTLFPTMGRVSFARYKGMTLAAALTVHHADTVTYLSGGHVPL